MNLSTHLLLSALLAFAFVSASVAQDVSSPKPVARMEFVTCPGCKLNKLPEVKRFLMDVVDNGDYPGVTVKFVPGRLPELFLYDADNQEIDKMYIERLSFAELNTLVRSKGFRRQEEINAEAAAAAAARRMLRQTA